ncbi:MAG: 2-hydroxyacyl-CoA dehydratase [Syntrophobacteraceae bacterium]
MEQKAIEKYEYMSRITGACDLFEWCIDTGATSAQELMPLLPNVLARGTEYHASLVPQAHPDLIAAIMKPKNSGAIKSWAVAARDYILDLCDRIDRGKPLIGVFPNVPLELFYAMDLAPIVPEMWSLILPATYSTGVEPELDDSEIEGFPGHVCAFQKAPLAAMEKGLLPTPSMFFKFTAACDSSNIVMQYTANKLNIGLYAIDSPYYSNRRAFKYFVDEIHRMIERIEKATGHTIDEDLLRHRVGWTNQFLDNLYKLDALRKNRPNPDPGMHRLLDLAALVMGGSTEKFVDYSRLTYQEALARHEKGETFLPEGKKEIRTLWTNSTFPYALYMSDWVEEHFGSTYISCLLSNLPADIFGQVNTSSVESMIEGLAWRTFNAPMHRTVMSHVDVYLNDMLSVAESGGAHCAIYAGNQSCKHSWVLPKLIGDLLQEELEIPSFNFEVDWVDGRFTPPDMVRNYLTEFFGTLT